MSGLNRLKAYVESCLDESGPGPIPPMSAALFAVSRVYGGLVQLRRRGYEQGWLARRRLPCPVISVGNLTLGGTGKTPMSLCLSDMLRKAGVRVVIISRGYGGTAQSVGGVVSDGKRIRMTADEAGDEPVMLASRLGGVPVMVGKDRYRTGIRACRELDAELILLDDAFQHMALYRDLDIVLLDGRSPVGNGHLFPRGRLREPVSALNRADAVVLTRYDGSRPLCPPMASVLKAVPTVFHARHRPVCFRIRSGRSRVFELVECDNGVLRGEPVSAFSGIADNDDFYQTLGKMGCRIHSFRRFADHHRYTDAELARLVENAHGFVVTTEKDFARIAHRLKPDVRMFVVGVDTDFGEQLEAVEGLIQKILQPVREKSSGTGIPIDR